MAWRSTYLLLLQLGVVLARNAEIPIVRTESSQTKAAGPTSLLEVKATGETSIPKFARTQRHGALDEVDSESESEENEHLFGEDAPTHPPPSVGPPAMNADQVWMDYLKNAHSMHVRFWQTLPDIEKSSLNETFQVFELLNRRDGKRGEGKSWLYRARHQGSGEEVALKCMPVGEVGDITKQWFLSHYLRRVGVSGVVLCEDKAYTVRAGRAPAQMQADGMPSSVCLQEPLLTGGTLTPISNLPVDISIKCLTDVATTLAEMHRHHMSHHDIKWENIGLEKKNGTIAGAQLLDLGSATIDPRKAEYWKDTEAFFTMLDVILQGVDGDSRFDDFKDISEQDWLSAKMDDVSQRMRSAYSNFVLMPKPTN